MDSERTHGTWNFSLSNELGRLAQGINSIKGNNIINFTARSEVPLDRIVTYANMVCDYISHRKKDRVYLEVGCDRLFYEDDAASPVTSLLEKNVKQHYFRCVQRNSFDDIRYKGLFPSNINGKT